MNTIRMDKLAAALVALKVAERAMRPSASNCAITDWEQVVDGLAALQVAMARFQPVVVKPEEAAV